MLEFPSTSGWMAIYSISDGCSLQAKTKVSPDTIFDFQYADDAAIPSHTAVGLQHSLHLLAATYQRAGLIVNTKKTEVLPQSVNTSSAAHPTFTVHGDSLNDVHQFTYLGSILTSDCDLNNEIQQRVKLASAAFGRLSHRVFLNRNLAIATKVAVCKAICIVLAVVIAYTALCDSVFCLFYQQSHLKPSREVFLCDLWYEI